MSHIALYRKYRSSSFDEVIGQEHVTRVLANAIDRGTFVHAYLLSGPRGCGKTSTARLMARALNCEKGPTSTPCGACPFCLDIPAGRCVDVVEMDAASETGIDDIRESVIERAKYQPLEARFKVYVIDEVHDLSPKAFDALLKTIEEPPPHVVFILATTDAAKVPATVRSRCQRHEFRRGSIPNLVSRLQTVAEAEGISIEPGALGAIARLADGGYRDALSLLEQVSATADGPITLDDVSAALGLVSEEVSVDLLTAMANGDAGSVLRTVDDAMLAGREPRAILESLLHKTEELVRIANGVIAPGTDSQRSALLHEQVTRIGKEKLTRFWPKLAEAHAGLRQAGLPRIWLEVALVGLADAPAPPPQRQEPTKAVVQKQAAVVQPKAEEPKPSIEPPPVPDDTPEELQHLAAVWRKVLGILFEKSKGAAKTLSGSRVIAAHDRHVIVEIQSEVMYEKLADPQSKAAKELLLVFRETIGENVWALEYRRANAPVSSDEPVPETVAMPLEGDELARAIETEMGGERITS